MTKRLMRLAGLGVVFGMVLSGCTQHVSSSDYGADGSVVKVVTIKESMLNSMAGMGADPDEQPQSLKDKIEFVGEGWKVTEEDGEEGPVLRAEKRMSRWDAPGAEWKLKISDKVSVMAKSGATGADGEYVFEEKYWLEGEIDHAKRDESIAEVQSKLQENWLKGSLSDTDSKRLAETVIGVTTRIMFGPNDPIVMMMMGSAKRFEREYAIRAYQELTPHFVGVNEMSWEEARLQTKKLLEVWRATKSMGEGSIGGQAEEDGETENSYAISVSFKGPVVKEQNGKVDPTNDEIFWDFYSQTLESGPVTCMVRFRK